MDARGFTLIEVLVAGLISVIVPGVIITLLRVNNSELAFNSAQSRMTQISNLVSEDIRLNAEKATFVYDYTYALPNGDCPATAPPSAPSTAYGVVLCDAAKTMIKGFRVIQVAIGDPIGRLEERDPGGEWKPYQVAGDIVEVNYNPDPFRQKVEGLFGVAVDGRFMWFSFRYNMNVSGIPATLAMQTESVVCRDAVSRP